MRAVLSRFIMLLAVFVAACGGGDGTGGLQPLKQQPLRAQAALTGEALIDWAETTYPTLFPGHKTTQVLASGGVTYHYRGPYSTGNYAGYGDDGLVYVLSAQLTGGQIQSFGRITDYTCNVYPGNCTANVNGTAAAGGAIAGATVTLIGSDNVARVATTSATGAFSIGVGGLSGAPYLLKVAKPGGGTLYGVAVDSGIATVANVTPLTDLIVRSWYAVQGRNADAAFAAPTLNAPPSELQARAVAQAVFKMAKLSFDVAGAGLVHAKDMIDKPFTANHTGIDAVFDALSITYTATGASVSVGGGGIQQNTSLTYDTARAAMTAATTTTGLAGSSNSSLTSLIPVTPDQVDAWSSIEAGLAAFVNQVNSDGVTLSSVDLVQYLDPGLLNDGLNRDQQAADLAEQFRNGQALAVELQTVTSLDLAAGVAETLTLASQTYQGQTSNQSMPFVFKKVNGSWLFSGDQQIAKVRITAEARVNQGALAGNNGPSINYGVWTIKGTVNSVSVESILGNTPMQQGSVEVDYSGAQLDSFFANTGAIAVSAVPPPGTIFNVKMALSGGSTVSQIVTLNSLTTEPAPITNLTGTQLSGAHLGSPLTVQWTLPRTYAIAEVQLDALTFTGSQSSSSTFECDLAQQPILGTTATSATITIPATCNGQPVQSVNINLSVVGVNGERSQTIYMYGN